MGEFVFRGSQEAAVAERVALAAGARRSGCARTYTTSSIDAGPAGEVPEWLRNQKDHLPRHDGCSGPHTSVV